MRLPEAPIAAVVPARKRPLAVSYLGFRSTEDGREYSLRAASDSEARLFVMLITHDAFTSRYLRFQDAPGLCFAKLQRELAADPDLLPGTRRVISVDELLEYRDAQETRAPERKRRAPSSSSPGG